MKSISVNQEYHRYTPEDHQTWATLAKRQKKSLSSRISKEYLIGLEKLQMDENNIVKIDEISDRLQGISGWSLMPVEGLIPPKEFFSMLLDKKYPITIFIRKPWELDFSEQPDIFHDIYGHLPLLINDKFTRFLSAYSAIAYKYVNNERAMELLARLYWFTYEMGVIHEQDEFKPYGGAIITSTEESSNVTNGKVPVHPFDLSHIFDTPFNPYALQNEYFVVNSFDDLFASLENIEAALIRALAKDETSEEHRLLVAFNDTIAAYPQDKTVLDLFAQQVAKTPGAIAVVHNNQKMTYRELDERSNQLGHYLQRKGVKEESLVPVCMERSTGLMIALLGILKAGGVYVPIDPVLPEDRIEYLLEDCNAGIIISNSTKRTYLPLKEGQLIVDLDRDGKNIDREPTSVPRNCVSGSHLVYVVYTSGTTGKPKGVMIEHAGLVNLCIDHIAEFGMTEADNYLQFMSPSFDGSILDIFITLTSGATLVLPGKEVVSNLEQFVKFVDEQRITIFTVTPSYLSILNKATLPTVRTIISAGEAVILEDALYYSRFKNFYNGYGPSEVTVNATLFKVSDSEEYGGGKCIPIGSPRSNKRIYILNSDKTLCPIGSTGEIYISGAGLARGYLNRPDLTAEKFIADPFGEEGARMYKTGDLGRWDPDGNIEYLGRQDDQVKIGGYRIELGEVESVLRQCEWVKEAVVLAREDKEGRKRLVAYVVPQGKLDREVVIQYLRTKLPHFMVPALWVELAHLPLTTNGKVDRKSLPDADSEFLEKQYQAPRNEVEATLSLVWQELLQIEKVGITDNFFELGGDSIVTIKIVGRLKSFGYAVDATDLFLYQTIERLSKVITNRSAPAFETIEQQASKQVFDSREKEGYRLGTYSKSLIPARTGGGKIPLYIVCGGGGTVFKFKKLIDMLDENQPVYVLQHPTDIEGLASFPTDIKGIAARYISEMLQQNPEGPYALSGHCIGGIVALEMAKQLETMGKSVELLALFDTIAPETENPEITATNFWRDKTRRIKQVFLNAFLKVDFEAFLLARHTKSAIEYKANSVKKWINKAFPNIKTRRENVEFEIFNEFGAAFASAAESYEMTTYNKGVLVFYAKDNYYFVDKNRNISYRKVHLSDSVKYRWNSFARSAMYYEIEGEHSTMFDPGFGGRELAMKLQEHLNRCNERILHPKRLRKIA